MGRDARAASDGELPEDLFRVPHAACEGSENAAAGEARIRQAFWITLDEKEPTALVELARQHGRDGSTMSLNVERLVRRGYVRRTRARRTGGVCGCYLTASGFAIARSKHVLEPSRVDAMLNELRRANAGQALKGLALLADARTVEWRGKRRAAELAGRGERSTRRKGIILWRWRCGS